MKLTAYTRFSGCGAKLGPGVLEQALCGLAQPAYPELLADFSGSEDAGLFRLGPHQALVQTVDFFPPIVDDPRTRYCCSCVAGKTTFPWWPVVARAAGAS